MGDTENLVVVHYLGGRLAKGIAPDFNQNRDSFHLFTSRDQTEGTLVDIEKLKAVFFVKSLDGNPGYRDPIFTEDSIKSLTGMKLKIRFTDGELLYATTLGYSPARKGFFVYPLDKGCNNERVFINSTATVSVEVIR